LAGDGNGQEKGEGEYRRYFAVMFPLLIVSVGIETALIVKLG
jgi:hypothetical protein